MFEVPAARTTRTGGWCEGREEGGGEEREGEAGGCGLPDDPGLTGPPAGQVPVRPAATQIDTKQSVSQSVSVSCSDTARHRASLSLAWPGPAVASRTYLGQFDYYYILETEYLLSPTTYHPGDWGTRRPAPAQPPALYLPGWCC